MISRRAEGAVVIDFGAQYARLIARRAREAGVYSEIVPRNISAAALVADPPGAIILSGGPASVYSEDAYPIDPAILGLGIPVLGICYGHQLIAHQLGGMVTRTPAAEYGSTQVSRQAASLLLDGFPQEFRVWMSHGDAVSRPPPGFRVTAQSPGAPVAAMEDASRRLYGVQFHPEVIHTEHGQRMFAHFLTELADLPANWTGASIIEEAVEEVRARVGNARAICALSGGVDSAVAAAIVKLAIGDRLTCVFIDSGLLRENEANQVVETFGRVFPDLELVHVDASREFLDRLAGVTDPEEKRKAVGATFIDVFERVAADVPDAKHLVQGTLYPDVIESGTADAARIKTHHNVGGLPSLLPFELVEPLRHLFKDEVRAIGRQLGVPAEILDRQPFPGPGLAVRIAGEVTRDRLAMLRAADAIIRREIEATGLTLWQVFGVLLADVRTVGVQGDARTFAHPLVVRAVTSQDAMTADWARLDHQLLANISQRITNEVAGVNRVLYDISSKPPATIEWE